MTHLCFCKANEEPRRIDSEGETAVRDDASNTRQEMSVSFAARSKEAVRTLGIAAPRAQLPSTSVLTKLKKPDGRF